MPTIFNIHILPVCAIILDGSLMVVDKNELFDRFSTGVLKNASQFLPDWQVATSTNSWCWHIDQLRQIKSPSVTHTIEMTAISPTTEGWHRMIIQSFVSEGFTGFSAVIMEIPKNAPIGNDELLSLRNALFESGIVSITDKSGKIIEANNKFCEISKYTSDELVGHDHRIINSGTHPKSFFGELWRTISQGGVWRGDICNRAKDGSIYWVDTVITPLFDHDNKINKFLSIRYLITDKVKFQQELIAEKKIVEQHEQNLLNILSNNQQAYALIDKDRKILFINRLAKVYYQNIYSAELSEGLDLNEAFPDGRLSTLNNFFSAVLGGEQVNFNTRVRSKSKVEYWFNLSINPAYDSKGEIFGVLLGAHDVTEEHTASGRINDLLQSLRRVYNHTPALLFTLDKRMNISHVSQYWLDFLGYKKNEVIGKSPLTFMDGYSTLKLSKAKTTIQLLRDGNVTDFPIRWKTRDDRYLDMLLSAVVDRDVSGKVTSVLAILVDVTALKTTQTKLLRNELSLIEAQQIGKLSGFTSDLAMGTWEGTATIQQILGWPDEKHRTLRSFFKCIPISERYVFLGKVREALKSKSKLNAEFGFCRPDNGLEIRLNLIAKIRQQKKVVGTVVTGTLQDVSESYAKQQELREVYDRLKTATEAAQIGVWEYDFNSRTFIFNDIQAEIFEVPDHPVKTDTTAIFQYLDQIMHPDDKPNYDQFRQNNLKSLGDSFFTSFRLTLKNQIKHINSYSRLIRDENNLPMKLIGVSMDISLQKNHEEKLRNALEEKDVLLREVHHRVKNNLQLVSSILSLKSYEIESAQARQIFEEANLKIRSMAIAHDKLFQTRDYSQVDLVDYFTHLIFDLKAMIGAESLIEINIEGEAYFIELDLALSLGLIVNELVINALKHGFASQGEGNIFVKVIKMELGGLEVDVMNNGTRIEENFKQLASSSKGMGIALVKTYVDQFKGCIEVKNENELTGFRINLGGKKVTGIDNAIDQDS